MIINDRRTMVEPQDPAAVERLIRYVMRPPVALERLHYDEAAGVVEIRPRELLHSALKTIGFTLKPEKGTLIGF